MLLFQAYTTIIHQLNNKCSLLILKYNANTTGNRNSSCMFNREKFSVTFEVICIPINSLTNTLIVNFAILVMR